MPIKLNKLSDQNYSVLLFCLLSSYQVLYLFLHYPFEINFGYEFGAVADAILDGKGYSNPWKFNSGTTATVLPFLVYFHLVFFYLFGKTLTSFIIISILKFASYSFCYYFLIKSLRINNFKIHHLPLLGLFFLFIFFSSTLNFEHTGDLWLHIFSVSWLFYGISNYFNGDRKTATIHLSIFYLLMPQINPSIALAGIILFMIISIFNFFKLTGFNTFVKSESKYKIQIIKEKLHPIIKHGFAFALLFSLSVSIWSVRNYIIFKSFIPTKSNLWMEYYLTNMHDEDGLLSYSTVLKFHPIGSDSLKNLFIVNGEKEMMKRFADIGREHRKNNFGQYLTKSLNRLINAFVYTEYDMDIMPSKAYESFESSDKLVLSDAKYIVKGTWVCLDLTPSEFDSVINKLNINKKKEVFKDWLEARNRYFDIKNSLRIIFRSIVMGILVTTSIVFLLFTGYKSNLLFISAIIFYIIYLLPYILVSHQLRYHRPLFAAQIIILYCLFLYLKTKINILFKPIHVSKNRPQ